MIQPGAGVAEPQRRVVSPGSADPVSRRPGGAELWRATNPFANSGAVGRGATRTDVDAPPPQPDALASPGRSSDRPGFSRSLH